jgi:hypothetical protein
LALTFHFTYQPLMASFVPINLSPYACQAKATRKAAVAACNFPIGSRRRRHLISDCLFFGLESGICPCPQKSSIFHVWTVQTLHFAWLHSYPDFFAGGWILILAILAH